jgi:anaerobic selenocysteine-containing dehydrogenase
VYHKDGKLISIEGDPDSPISSGRLCPNSDTYELHTPGRLKKLKYRRPYSQRWEDLDLETAMGMVATRVWESRERTFVEKENGALVSGDSTNDLLPISEEPNVRIMEAKALMCDITPGKRPRGKEALDFFATKMRAA